MDPILVVGAGISGATCARTLRAAGLPVRLLERSRRPGGRMASRRIGGRRVDLGASYFTVSDSRFQTEVERWRDAGLAHPWTDSFSVRDDSGEWRTTSGPLRWGASRGLRSLVESVADGLDLEVGEVAEVSRDAAGTLSADGRSAPAVVLAMPDPQARRLLATGLRDEGDVLTDPFDPILALTTVWDRRRWDLDGAFVNGDEDLSWVADDGRRRGDGAAVLVAHSTPGRARQHLADPAEAVEVLTTALRRVLAIDETPRHAEVHRWTYAKPTGSREATFLLTDSGLGLCGDAWSTSAKVETAYLSGLELGEALVARFG